MTRLHTDTPPGYIVFCLALIGFGLGLVITPASNMVMNSVSRTKQGMVSSLTSLERFAPLTLGIAFFNLAFIQGVPMIAANSAVTKKSPADLQVHVLASGFDFAFFLLLPAGDGDHRDCNRSPGRDPTGLLQFFRTPGTRTRDDLKKPREIPVTKVRS